MRPRLLDLFCGAGGCSVGYDRAGFDVTGVDIEPHPDYPFEIIVGDAMTVLEGRAGIDLDDFDVVHASPPCPFYSTATIPSARDRHPDLVPPTFAALRKWGGVWVIENVPGAPMPGAVMLCGGAMGLPRIRRHRLFASSAPLMSPGCACTGAEVVGVYGGKRGWGRNAPRPDGTLPGPASTHPRRSLRGHGHRLDDQAGRRVGRDPAELHRVHRRAAPRPVGGRSVSAAYVHGDGNSTDHPEYLYVETRPDGAWVEIYRGDRSLGIELDAEQVERLRQVLRGSP